MIAYGAYPKESKSAGAIEKLGLSKDEYYLIVGRLIPDNNVETIILGFNQSKTKKISGCWRCTIQ